MSRSNASQLVAQILNPSLANSNSKKSSPAVNHTARNRAALKELQAKNRETTERKRAEEENKEIFKMARFKSVESTVRENLATGRLSASPERKQANFLRKGTGVANRPQSATSGSLSPSAVRAKSIKASLPSREELEAAALQVEEIHSRSAKNFIAANAREAITARPPDSRQGDHDRLHSNFGQLPKYLVDRKAEMEAEKAAKEAAKSKSNIKIPPGMKLLTEEERLQTLEVLKQNLVQLQNQLERFPLAVDTLSRKKAKAELEGKIKEIEQAIELFSRKVVFIAE